MLEKYKLGIDIIDKQHEKLFELIEKLCNDCTKDELINMIKELKDYSEYHFATEEKYFDNLNFKFSEEHKRLHENFTLTIEYYFENPEKLKKEKIYSFLNSWIKKHILIEDKKYTKKQNIQ